MMAAPAKTPDVMLSDLLAGFVDPRDYTDCVVTGLTLDSRKVRQNDVFVALSGTRERGHDYIAHALAADAAAVLWDRATGVAAIDQAKIGHGRRHAVPILGVEKLRERLGEIAARFHAQPSDALRVFGVTGTNGKTSCAQFIARALNADAPCGVIGTLGYGLIDRLNPSSHTTPDAISVQAHLAEMRDAGATAVVMEVSSHALDQHRVNGVKFHCAVFTNLTRDHLDYHGDMRDYGAAKARLFAFPELRHAVLNADDEFGRWLMSRLPASIDAVSYGLAGDLHEPRPTLFAERVELLAEGLRLDIRSPWGRAELNSKLLGRFNASNLLATLGTLLVTGMPFASAIDRVQQLNTVPGRMQRFGGGGRPLLVVDYAHTPDALEHVLKALREHCHGRLTCVFGCGGDRDRGKRPLMGRIAEQLADAVIVTDDNPRTEDAARIVQDIREGMQQPDRAAVIHDRAAAIRQAFRHSGPDDVVLIAGKGHETYQIVGQTQLEFSDAVQAQSLLKEARQ
jgi:UDP-N-acetylmuramoyl-L-alanyl-D-glutamate--2,6-diaminopimelate ligase